jgi:FOG: WD40-like repeat
VDGDLVVCTPGGASATLLALNRRTGDVVWKSSVPGGDAACYASVVSMTIAGKKQYVQFLRNGLVGVDAVTGKFLWRFDKTAETRMGGNIPTPVAFENHVYSGSGMTGAGLARVLESNGGFETEQVYMSKKLPNAIGGAVKVGDYLYGTGGTTLYCVDFKTGAVKWEERSIAPASIVSADGKLFLHGEKGDVALVEASPGAYRELGRFTPPEQPERKYTQAWAYPALANGKLYVRDLNCLWCYDVSGK